MFKKGATWTPEERAKYNAGIAARRKVVKQIKDSTPFANNLARPAKQEQLTKYLELYSAGMPSGQAGEVCGLGYHTIQHYRETDPAFAKAWQKAYDAFTDVLEKRAEHMALECKTTSPTMLIFMLKARKPSVYRDNVKMEHSGQVTFATEFATAMQRAEVNGVTATQH